MNTILSENYVLIEVIGSGSFGEVYSAQHKITGAYVAAKVEKKSSKIPRIETEYKIYCYLNRHGFRTGLPKVHHYYETPVSNVMIMQLLGPSLEDLFNKYNKKFTLPTVILLAKQLIHLLEQLHKGKFIHRDIKPNNFLIGRGSRADQIFIMDFGLSKKYILNDKHIKYRTGRSLIGTARYASLNMHKGFEPSRRDDLESVGYMLVYFLKGELPWQGIKKAKNVNHIEKIGEIKTQTPLYRLCEGIHDNFKEYINYCRSLSFDGDPDYEYIYGLFDKIAKDQNIVPKFQWDTQNNVIRNHL